MGPSSLALRPLPWGWAHHKGPSVEPLVAVNGSSARPQTSPASTWLLAPPLPASTSAVSLAQRTELGGGRGACSEPDRTLPDKPPLSGRRCWCSQPRASVEKCLVLSFGSLLRLLCHNGSPVVRGSEASFRRAGRGGPGSHATQQQEVARSQMKSDCF